MCYIHLDISSFFLYAQGGRCTTTLDTSRISLPARWPYLFSAYSLLPFPPYQIERKRGTDSIKIAKKKKSQRRRLIKFNDAKKKNAILSFESISLDQNPLDCSTGNRIIQGATLKEREGKKEETTRIERLVEGRRGERVEEMSSDDDHGDQESNTYPIDRVFSLGERRSNGGECSHIKRREESYWRARGMGPGGGPSFSDSGTLIRSPPTLLVTASPIVFLHRPSSCTPLLAPSFPRGRRIYERRGSSLASNVG